jgi:mannose-1-phosphate guanylyltransferase/mannose-6-phosphate isomerase
MFNFVVLCGGSGSRLWPLSRQKLPKQLLKITNEYTMLQNTLLRIYNLKINESKFDDIQIFIICNKEHSYIVDFQVKEINLPFKIFILNEPIGRDSAPAVCISTLITSSEDYTYIIPSDHIFDNKEFNKCCVKSLDYIDNSIITFGINPTSPETGYGYIHINSNNETIKFVEKPKIELARKFFDEKTYLWNAGIFCFKNFNMIECFKKYAPDILEKCSNTIKNTVIKSDIINLSETDFINCRAISIDYAIMEPLCNDTNININKITIKYDSYWNDIGSFSALFDELKKNNDNNVLDGDIITLDTNDCYIKSEKELIATIGVKDLVIVNTADAMLVCNKNNTQDIKILVEYLKNNNRDEHILHKKVFRPWGYYENVHGNDVNGFKIKKITVYPGKRLSLQSHNHRSEHWVIVNGKSKVTVGINELYLNKDDHVYIPVNTIHRIENVGSELLEFTETQIGNYLGEDDIVRYEDDYGRT